EGEVKRITTAAEVYEARTVIISEMLELGSASHADHTRTGELAAAAGAQVLVTIGQGAAPAAQAARAAGVHTIELPDAQAAIELLDGGVLRLLQQ
ncbi:UDP-N-acetylmuramoyl-tripeptide-D-alanyl-D-alanine ligase, partial [human gut metagenome]